MSDVTQILGQIEDGDGQAAEKLLPLVYDELRKMAAAKMAQENPGQTLQATALVHEAYIRLVGGETAKDWTSRAHFFGAAAEAMRRILIENARRKKRQKHGGAFRQMALDEAHLAVESPREDLLALDEALERLEQTDPQTAELVKLRYFAGLTFEQSAEMLQIPLRTAYRNWAYARAWLYRQMNGDPTQG
jgi:RNA polymerase sigma factor (TIGR02999 family)